MNIESASTIDYYSTNGKNKKINHFIFIEIYLSLILFDFFPQFSVQINQFKCDICALTFRTSCERNMHILNHLEKISCSICHETLVQIGNIWYSPHKHSNHNRSTAETRQVDADEYGTTYQFDPLSTKNECDLILNSSSDDGFLETNNIDYSTVASLESKDIGEIHTEHIERPERSESSATEINKTKNVTTEVSENIETNLKNKRTKSPKPIVTRIKRQKRSTASTQKCWTCELCSAEFLFEANLIEHQDEHEKSTFQCDQNVDNTPSFAVGSMEDTEKSNVIDDNMEISTYDDIKNLAEAQLNSLKCPICNKKFMRQNGLKSHLHVHKTVYTCKLCKNAFPTMGKYRSHQSSVHNKIAKESQEKVSIANTNNTEIDVDPVDWICEYCNGDFDLELNLAKHLVKEHSADKSEHICNICTEKLATLKDLLAHMRAHSESNQHKCSIDGCTHGFAYKASLVIHLNKHKRTNSQTIIRKTQDDLSETAKQYATISIESLNEMTSNDKTPKICEICSKELASRASLLLHIQSVHMNQRIQCTNDNCNKIFRSINGLHGHIKVHHPEEVQKCDICHKFVYSKAKFTEHRLRHSQSEANAGSFACNICTMTFVRKRELRLHQNKHEKAISCTLCNDKFSTVKLMMAHRERHGKKPVLTCRYQNCNKVFEDRREFMKHASQHPEIGKKRYICPYCGKSLSRTYIAGILNLYLKPIF